MAETTRQDRQQSRFGGLTLQSLGSVPDAWVSQLQNGFSVGVREAEYLPRGDSASAERVDAKPSACTDGIAALVINHEGWAPEDDRSALAHHWWIKACVPEYTRSSPFEYTGNKQTISETLYPDMYSDLTCMFKTS